MGTWIHFLCSRCERAINILTVWSCKTNRKSSVLRFRFESENWTCTSDKPAQAYDCITANLHGLPLPLFALSYRFISFILCHSLSPSLYLSLFTSYENIPDISFSKPLCVLKPCGLDCACMNNTFSTALHLMKWINYKPLHMQWLIKKGWKKRTGTCPYSSKLPFFSSLVGVCM